MWRFNVPGKNRLLEKTNQVDLFIRTYQVGPPKLPRRVYTRLFPAPYAEKSLSLSCFQINFLNQISITACQF
jgi:hypothetical protein